MKLDDVRAPLSKDASVTYHMCKYANLQGKGAVSILGQDSGWWGRGKLISLAFLMLSLFFWSSAICAELIGGILKVYLSL